jgi:two-component system, OmpR family, sensor kinase
MLTRIESAFVSQRQLLDDAGHELRTPLTVMRGHLELMDPRHPEEVSETQELLVDEVDRMSRLVEDLVLLSKSQRPDFLNRAEVDLNTLTKHLLSKARALGDRAWQLGPCADGHLIGDEQRLTQAVLQLAHNAVKHTDPAETIQIGSRITPQAAELWVSDHGEGVPLFERNKIFERFSRSSVRPDDDGTGLGLSIVRAIAEAHGGEVLLEDVLPRGSRFTIVIPQRSS